MYVPYKAHHVLGDLSLIILKFVIKGYLPNGNTVPSKLHKKNISLYWRKYKLVGNCSKIEKLMCLHSSFAEALHNTINKAAKDLTDLLVAYLISWECSYLSQ